MFRNYIKLDTKRERYKTKHAKNWLLYSLGGALLMTFEIQPKELKFNVGRNFQMITIYFCVKVASKIMGSYFVELMRLFLK